ncbi:hypothetical protein BOX15_Mlig017110g3 [Macrostomum lignano]|uniref:Mandelate racemase/muconate lactonizing enzyme C-terminal domain-containing protein n=1 Tax=Macrostomum lignano TaxID=282301 RepID=A0A267GHI5_9PLAT|nr:hypothetical protein BOX15_Mlig017110g3 [Macrostomum lignano]
MSGVPLLGAMASMPRIREVRAYVRDQLKAAVTNSGDRQGADCHDVDDRHWINGYPTPIANPMSCYSQYRATRKSWGINALGSMIVEVEAEDGTTGVGVTIAGEPGCYIVENHLSRFIEGEDPRNIEKMWDCMYRATVNYGRKGLTLQAISAVDLALWDLLGRLRGEPVYNLLGGLCRDRLPVYCTTARPDIAQKLGFAGAKVPCPHGPAEGDAGLRRNVAYFADWRRKVGPDFPLMLDCYMALSVPYSLRLAKALEPHGLRWLEEPLHPDDYPGYRRLADSLMASGSTVQLTCGEHEYSRYGFRDLIDGGVTVLQPDITWLGGITEARRVVAMAAARDAVVVPHGSSVYSYHLQMAFPNCPLGEFINLSPEADTVSPYFGNLFLDEPLPERGFVRLAADRPGFGVTLNREDLRRPCEGRVVDSKHQRVPNKMDEELPVVPF